ncbi:MAG: septum formation initiator family protein [Blastocatellia bacterium]|nr:septum formation initiator family protein [Blastocatellia bacterium]
MQPSVGTFTLPRVEVQQFSIPFSAWLSMIFLALGALCISVGVRTHNEMLHARQEKEVMQQKLNERRAANERLNREIGRLASDSRVIEQAAREMGMVKQNEVVVIIPK